MYVLRMLKMGGGRNASRNSSIELLKILAMFCIVVFHVNMSLGVSQIIPPYHSTHEALQPVNLTLQTISYFGVIGNVIFWVCSCWFLVSDSRMSVRKVFFTMADVWVISMLVFMISACFIGLSSLKGAVINSVFPTLLSNNWYITCYLILYALHPLLNKIINGFDQRSYFRFVIVFFLLYSITTILYPDLLFTSELIVFAMIYFVVGYLKQYGEKLCCNRRLNLMTLALSIAALCAYTLLFDYLSVNYGIATERSQFWRKMGNPFVIMMAVSLFNLFRSFEFRNSIINYISSLTLFIYIIHENIVVPSLYREPLWQWIADRFGTDALLIKHLTYSAALFVVSLVLGIMYKETLHRWIAGLLGRLYGVLSGVYKSVENRMLG